MQDGNPSRSGNLRMRDTEQATVALSLRTVLRQNNVRSVCTTVQHILYVYSVPVHVNKPRGMQCSELINMAEQSDSTACTVSDFTVVPDQNVKTTIIVLDLAHLGKVTCRVSD